MAQRQIINRNVLLIPPPEVTQEAIRRSTLVANQVGTAMRLDTEKKLPHITLHQFAIPEESLGRLEAIVRDIAEGTASLPITLNAYSVFGGTGIFWDAEKTDPLYTFHERLVREIDPLREGYIMDQHRAFLTNEVDIGLDRRLSLAHWGNPLAIETFYPHITLAACQNEEDVRKALQALSSEAVEFEALSIHVTEVGPNGTCPGSLTEIPLE